MNNSMNNQTGSQNKTQNTKTNRPALRTVCRTAPRAAATPRIPRPRTCANLFPRKNPKSIWISDFLYIFFGQHHGEAAAHALPAVDSRKPPCWERIQLAMESPVPRRRSGGSGRDRHVKPLEDMGRVLGADTHAVSCTAIRTSPSSPRAARSGFRRRGSILGGVSAECAWPA